MELKNIKPKKKKKEKKVRKEPIDYVITHYNLDTPRKVKTTGFKNLKEARKVANVMAKNNTFINLKNKKGVELCR